MLSFGPRMTRSDWRTLPLMIVHTELTCTQTPVWEPAKTLKPLLFVVAKSNCIMNEIVGKVLISLLPPQRALLWESIKGFSISEVLFEVSRAESRDNEITDTVHGSETRQVPAVVEESFPWLTLLSKVLCTQRKGSAQAILVTSMSLLPWAVRNIRFEK